MAERAAHLVDHVFPVVPVRQWVLSLPHRLRYVLALDHALCRAVSGIFVRAVLRDLRRRARQAGVPGGRGGAVAIIQRLRVGAQSKRPYPRARARRRVRRGGGRLRFHEAEPPTDEDMDRLRGTIDRRVHHLLSRRREPGDVDDGSPVDPWQEGAPVLAGIAAASVQRSLRTALLLDHVSVPADCS